MPRNASELRNNLRLLSIEDDTPPVTLPDAISTETLSICYPSNRWHGEQSGIGVQPSHPTEYEEHLELVKTVKDLGHQVISDAKLFYFPPPTSLEDHISNWPSINYNHLYLPHEVLFLAKHIASAVLYFHATPFLQENWTSHCIALFETEGKSASKRRTLTDPNLKVLIPHRLKQDNESESVTSRPRAMIRNPYTFTLGIILIELAHQKPWQLLKDEDQPDEGDAVVTKFDLVDKFAVGMTTLYGICYKKMVRKCINCDFGEGRIRLEKSKTSNGILQRCGLCSREDGTGFRGASKGAIGSRRCLCIISKFACEQVLAYALMSCNDPTKG